MSLAQGQNCTLICDQLLKCISFAGKAAEVSVTSPVSCVTDRHFHSYCISKQPCELLLGHTKMAEVVFTHEDQLIEYTL